MEYKNCSFYLMFIIRVTLCIFTIGVSSAVACDSCSCGNGTFGTSHCCISNGDCISGDTCQAGLCEPAVPSCSADFCNANNEQNCGTICFDGSGTEECKDWCLNGQCCNGGGFTPGVQKGK